MIYLSTEIFAVPGEDLVPAGNRHPGIGGRIAIGQVAEAHAVCRGLSYPDRLPLRSWLGWETILLALLCDLPADWRLRFVWVSQLRGWPRNRIRRAPRIPRDKLRLRPRRQQRRRPRRSRRQKGRRQRPLPQSRRQQRPRRQRGRKQRKARRRTRRMRVRGAGLRPGLRPELRRVGFRRVEP
jgi:hypothetical protein